MVEMVGFHQVMWLVMLESVMNRILGVDTLGQQVMPCLRHGTNCLLIRGAIGSVPCSDKWEVAWSFTQAHKVQEGPWYRDNPGKP
jgi:hypothetical protein